MQPISMRNIVLVFLFSILVYSHTAVSDVATPAPAQTPNSAVVTPVAQLSNLETQKLSAEVKKLEAEIASIQAIGKEAKWWTTVLASIGTIVGAVVGGIFTFVITRTAQRYDRLQKELEQKRSERERDLRDQEDRLNRLKLRQEREHARDMHNLRLFQDLGHESHRARLAAASVLLDRLHRLENPSESEEQLPHDIADAPLIKKVLVAVLKRQDQLSLESTSVVEQDTTSEATLRKYIADELVETLQVRFAPDKRPDNFGRSRLGEGREFQECDLANIYWAFVDARHLDFFGSDLTKASLRGAALQQAVFYEATLVSTILRDADLRKANFMGADLRYADLRKADLRGANLQGANLEGADLEGANLDGAVINIEEIRQFSATRLPSHFFDSGHKGTQVKNEVYRPKMQVVRSTD